MRNQSVISTLDRIGGVRPVVRADPGAHRAEFGFFRVCPFRVEPNVTDIFLPFLGCSDRKRLVSHGTRYPSPPSTSGCIVFQKLLGYSA